MAQIFGEPGRNAAEKSFQQTKQVLRTTLCSIGALTALAGYALSGVLPIPRFSLTATLLVLGIMAVLMWLIGKWGMDKLDTIDRNRMAWRKGAAGESLVAGGLAPLPGEFVVVNDVTKRFANIDHIVIGPTGVYVIDTKNWKG